ncbi:MAG TPA: ADOP family duplicated permease [Bryobacteraceae bacterium]|nr:ADOP family duplicated permease [Bryobacteraceae bacterium]
MRIHETALAFLNDLKFAARSLGRAKGLTITVVLTLALGIGGNAAIFSLVRGVLLRPLVNRDENRLIYIRQTAPGFGDSDMPFSVPEIQDLRSGTKSFSEFGDFSVMGFTMIGLGPAREVRSGVVNGSYFHVMGLRPVLGRLLDARDDGPAAAGAAVLTWKFWSTVLHSDPSVIGKTVRLDSRTATIVGVLEPCVPYPADTEMIANIVTSPHHLSATMVTGRVHRMTQLFARLAPGVDLDKARADLRAVYGAMLRQHPEAYPASAHFAVDAVLLRDQITAKARTVLLVLLAASALVFIIACSNVANLVLARTVRREGELAIRAALGAGTAALRRALLAESLLLCVAGAAVGLAIASPMVSILARYAARFSVRALELRVDSTLLWTGGLLAVIAAVLLAYVPRLPGAGSTAGFSLANSNLRITGSTTRRLRAFVVVQIAASFLLLAGAGVLVKTLLSLQAAQTGMDVRRVLVLNVPAVSYGKTPDQIVQFYKEAIRRVEALPAVDRVAVGIVTPWRDADSFGLGFDFTADGHLHGPGEQDPRAQFRTVSPGFFAALGVPLIAGRDFNDNDRRGSEPVVIVSQTLANRMFPNGDALNRHVRWTDPVMKFIDVSTGPRRIVGIAADIDDEHVVPGPVMTVYHPMGQQEIWGGRLFVHTRSDPYALVTPITRMIRGMSVDQPVEHAATLADVRAEVLTPDRLNALVFGVFAGIALAIAVVGVAGVLAFSVSGRTREFGIRLAIGSQPHRLLTGVMAEGAVLAVAGLVAGALAGYGLITLAAGWTEHVRTPGVAPILLSGVILLIAAVVASALPAIRAARVDVMQALRTE